MSHQPNTFDLIVLGGGPGGVAAAEAAAHQHMRVAIVNEGHFLGHSLEGAFKSKALYELSKIHFALRRYDRWARPPTDFFDTYQAQQRGADSLRELELRKLHARGITYFSSRGQFLSPHEIGVDRQVLRAENIIIATGTSPRVIDGIRPSKQQILTFNDIINVTRPVRSMVVLGGGVVGCEFASIFAALGTSVTVIESKPRLLFHDDPDLGDLLANCMADLGVRVIVNARCREMQAMEDGVYTSLFGGENLLSDVALLSVGRQPNTKGLCLSSAGVEMSTSGFIKTNPMMQTNVPHIYAIGDVATRPGKRVLRLVRIAEAEAEIAVSSLRGESNPLHVHHIPFTVYTHPTVAGAGLSEQEARQLFGDIRVGKWPHIRNHRSHMFPSQKGFTKLITGPLDDDRILGVRAIGEGAESIVSEISLMMQYRLPFTHLLDVPRAYPSFSESLRGAARVIARLEPPGEEAEEYAYELSGDLA